MTRQRTPLLLALFSLCQWSCRSEVPEPPPAASTALSPGSSSAAPVRGTPAMPANPAMGAPALLSDAHWKDFPGPHLKPQIAAARKVWGIRPVSDSFDAVTFGLLAVKQVAGDVVVVDGYVPAHVPGVFVQLPKSAKGLKKGDAVVVDTAGSGVLGRVVEVGDEVLVKYLWHGRVAEVGVAPEQLFALTGKLAFAEPILYRSGANWRYGRVAHAGKRKLWIVGEGGKPQQIDVADARPMPLRQDHRVGDTVWAARMGKLESAKVSAVLDASVAYEVRFNSDDAKSVLPYDWVIKPL